MIGYSGKAYRIFIPKTGRIMASRDLRPVELPIKDEPVDTHADLEAFYEQPGIFVKEIEPTVTDDTSKMAPALVKTP